MTYNWLTGTGIPGLAPVKLPANALYAVPSYGSYYYPPQASPSTQDAQSTPDFTGKSFGSMTASELNQEMNNRSEFDSIVSQNPFGAKSSTGAAVMGGMVNAITSMVPGGGIFGYAAKGAESATRGDLANALAQNPSVVFGNPVAFSGLPTSVQNAVYSSLYGPQFAFAGNLEYAGPAEYAANALQPLTFSQMHPGLVSADPASRDFDPGGKGSWGWDPATGFYSGYGGNGGTGGGTGGGPTGAPGGEGDTTADGSTGVGWG